MRDVRRDRSGNVHAIRVNSATIGVASVARLLREIDEERGELISGTPQAFTWEERVKHRVFGYPRIEGSG